MGVCHRARYVDNDKALGEAELIAIERSQLAGLHLSSRATDGAYACGQSYVLAYVKAATWLPTPQLGGAGICKDSSMAADTTARRC